ncbi:MAG: hypothetical protein D6815_07310 [Candidatus Dadabacteria bacterium]|nr:MAG: hypothetical protein D6815_07310 [Candidatus Dadabacteria bacterium]
MLLPPTLPLLTSETVLLFPGTSIRLRVCSPAQCQLIEDVARTGGIVGTVLSRQDSAEASASWHAVGCCATLGSHRRMRDGTWQVTLRGRLRFRVCGEASAWGEPVRPYPVVRVQALYEAPALAHEMRQLRDEIRRALEDYGRLVGAPPDSVAPLFVKLDLEGLVNYLSARLSWSPLEKQALLECPTIERRCRRLIALLSYRTMEGRLGLDPERGIDA